MRNASPFVGKIMSVSILSVVVFPAPFGPRKPTHFEPSILSERSERAVNEPYFFVRPTVTIDGELMGRNHHGQKTEV